MSRCHPLPSVNRLREAGWDLLAIAESHASIDDTAVMRLAREASRWLITFDRDYGELVFRQHLPPPPLVLLLRVPSYLPDEPAAWIEALYRRGQLEDGHFCYLR
jgi:predicted nuclease of predicted toxin-antitoxin system